MKELNHQCSHSSAFAVWFQTGSTIAQLYNKFSTERTIGVANIHKRGGSLSVFGRYFTSRKMSIYPNFPDTLVESFAPDTVSRTNMLEPFFFYWHNLQFNSVCSFISAILLMSKLRLNLAEISPYN